MGTLHLDAKHVFELRQGCWTSRGVRVNFDHFVAYFVFNYTFRSNCVPWTTGALLLFELITTTATAHKGTSSDTRTIRLFGSNPLHST